MGASVCRRVGRSSCIEMLYTFEGVPRGCAHDYPARCSLMASRWRGQDLKQTLGLSGAGDSVGLWWYLHGTGGALLEEDVEKADNLQKPLDLKAFSQTG